MDCPETFLSEKDALASDACLSRSLGRKEFTVPWEAIKYVSSAFTLIAFIAAIVLALYRRKLLSRERLIKLTPANERARLVRSTLEEFFDVHTERMTEERAYDLALRQIHARSQRYLINAVIVLAILVSSVVIVFISVSNKPLVSSVVSVTSHKDQNLRTSSADATARKPQEAVPSAPRATPPLRVSYYSVGGHALDFLVHGMLDGKWEATLGGQPFIVPNDA